MRIATWYRDKQSTDHLWGKQRETYGLPAERGDFLILEICSATTREVAAILMFSIDRAGRKTVHFAPEGNPLPEPSGFQKLTGSEDNDVVFLIGRLSDHKADAFFYNFGSPPGEKPTVYEAIPTSNSHVSREQAFARWYVADSKVVIGNTSEHGTRVNTWGQQPESDEPTPTSPKWVDSILAQVRNLVGKLLQ